MIPFLIYLLLSQVFSSVHGSQLSQCGARFGRPPLFHCYHIKDNLLPDEPAEDEAELQAFMPRFVEDHHLHDNPGRLVTLTPVTRQWG